MKIVDTSSQIQSGAVLLSLQKANTVEIQPDTINHLLPQSSGRQVGRDLSVAFVTVRSFIRLLVCCSNVSFPLFCLHLYCKVPGFNRNQATDLLKDCGLGDIRRKCIRYPSIYLLCAVEYLIAPEGVSVMVVQRPRA